MSAIQRLGMVAALASGLATSINASAEVADFAPNGFTTQTTVHIDAPPAKVFSLLLQPARWWSSEHTFSRDAANLTLDAKAGGCFCEKLPGGGEVMHLVVVNIDPGKLLRLHGALGPFQGSGVDGALTWMLKASGNGTDVTLTYSLGGYRREGFEQLSKAADGMLSEQVVRLKRAVEAGLPSGSPDKR